MRQRQPLMATLYANYPGSRRRNIQGLAGKTRRRYVFRIIRLNRASHRGGVTPGDMQQEKRDTRLRLGATINAATSKYTNRPSRVSNSIPVASSLGRQKWKEMGTRKDLAEGGTSLRMLFHSRDLYCTTVLHMQDL